MRSVDRRTFLKGVGVLSAATAAAAVVPDMAFPASALLPGGPDRAGLEEDAVSPLRRRLRVAGRHRERTRGGREGRPRLTGEQGVGLREGL